MSTPDPDVPMMSPEEVENAATVSVKAAALLNSIGPRTLRAVALTSMCAAVLARMSDDLTGLPDHAIQQHDSILLEMLSTMTDRELRDLRKFVAARRQDTMQ